MWQRRRKTYESYKYVSFLLQVVKPVVFFFLGGGGGGGGGGERGGGRWGKTCFDLQFQCSLDKK